MARALGEVVARGSRSAVYAYGAGAVIKIPDRSTPGDWIEIEATYTAAVREAGAPAARLLGVEEHGGRPASVWERVPGPSLWDCALRRPERCAEYGRVLAELQLGLYALVPPLSLPRQRDRLASKVRRSAELFGASLAGSLSPWPPDALPLRVCHGDLHPGNVIMAAGGPVVVDWFDVSRGDPVADVARSSILMSTGDGSEPLSHLPGAGAATLAPLARAHLSHLRSRMDLPDAAFERWQAIESVARLAEGVAPAGLLETWQRFDRRHDS